MARELWQVDAFAEGPFTGNPAAVCLVEEAATPDWMQSVAAEMNLSETAFVLPGEGVSFDLHWFTPQVEVDLCGHATLAAAHVLWEAGWIPLEDPALFRSRSGSLRADRVEHGIRLDLPRRDAEPAEAPSNLVEALGVMPSFVGRSGEDDYLVVVDDAEFVTELEPDLRLLATVEARGVIVTAAWQGPEFDFVSRFFAPRAGVPEDPVTGSAHCTLGPYWANRLRSPELRALQASARRGILEVEVGDDRVGLTGQAVTVLRGELFV